MTSVLIVVFFAAVMSWAVGIEFKESRRKRKLERNHREYLESRNKTPDHNETRSN